MPRHVLLFILLTCHWNLRALCKTVLVKEDKECIWIKENI